MPKTYRCSIYFAGHVDVEVEADSKIDAAQKAAEAFEDLDCREIQANVEYSEIQDVEEDENA